jgi:N-dimethylarginine dimethylaminohydrolase
MTGLPEDSPMRPHILMTDPTYFNVSYRINPWMDPGNWDAAAAEAAQRGSQALRDAIAVAGGAVETIAGVAGLPDLVFPANAAVVLDGKVLLARFLCAERQGEEVVFSAAFEGLRARHIVREVATLPPGVLQEGAGDAIWDAGRGFFWVGYGQRSSESSIAAIQETFGKPTVALRLASPRFYHLDTCFCPLTGGEVLYYPPAFGPGTLAHIEAHVASADRIEATAEDAAAFCVNAVNIGRDIIMATAPQGLRDRLEARGYRVHDVALNPFILSGGGAYCMTLRLDRSSVPTP